MNHFYLKKLHLINFKNYAEASIDFSEGINCLIGLNGSGKTNILDAIHYLSFCKGFINVIDSQNIKDQESLFMIQGEMESKDSNDTLLCSVKKGQKKQFKINKKDYERLADHIGRFPAVVIAPQDSELITEGSEWRRKFLDSVISQFNKEYLFALIDYNRIVSQRNALLKKMAESRQKNEDLLDVLNEQMIPLGEIIYKHREAFFKEFKPVFKSYYQKISEGKEEVDITYQSHLQNGDFGKLLKESVARDLAMQYTTKGIHKDDLSFEISGNPIKKFGSQGQQKTYLLALKLAQFEFIKEKLKLSPILLLDDIFDKLDSKRVKSLLSIISQKSFGQIFITDTDKERISASMKGIKTPYHFFQVKQSTIKQD